MPKRTKRIIDQERENRIDYEIIVDADDESARALSWYYYLEEKMKFPFSVICINKRPISPLKIGDEVKVIGMPNEEECEQEIFVTIQWEKESLAVPLSQLNVVCANKQTQLAVEDWHYWVQRGYQF